MQAATLSAEWILLGNLGTQAVRVCPNSGEGYYALGLSHLKRGFTFAAVRAFRQALLRSDDSTTHVRLAEAYFILNQYKFFAEEIVAAKTAKPDNPEPYYVAGRFLFQFKNQSKAADEFRQALLYDPEHSKALCYLGLSLKNMQHNLEAEQQLRKAIQVIETKKDSFYLPFQALASLYVEQNQISEALPLARRAVELAPNIAANQFLLGKVAWLQKDAELAVRALRAAIALDEAFIEARYLLAQVYRSRGEADAAKREFESFRVLKEMYGKGRLQ